MWRPAVVALLSTTLVLGGCATPRRPLLPPGADPDEVVEAIARRGRGDAPPVEYPPPPPPREPRRLTVWEKIGWSFAVILANAGIAAAFAALTRSEPEPLDLSEQLDEIWSAR